MRGALLMRFFLPADGSPWSQARPLLRAIIGLILLGGCCLASAQSVSLAGSFGDKALLVIDGAAPKAVAVGQSLQGVKVVRVGDDSAVVRVGGQQQILRVGASPVNLAGKGAASTVLQALPNGQFVTEGRINGKLVRMMVDTGATLVSLSREQANQLGISLQGGRPIAVHTANGVVAATEVMLRSVRVGTIERREVPAVIQDSPLPIVLLGMSFLKHLELQHGADQLTLTERY
jgi:aspartyl protease family protein